MPSRMLTLVGGPAGMAVVLAALATPAAAQAGGTPGLITRCDQSAIPPPATSSL